MHMLDKGHIALAISLINEDFYMAWGTIPEGDPVWSANPPAMAPSTTQLTQEVGRRKVTMKAFCKEDPNGTIEANNKLWSLSEEPTRNIYLQFKFNSTDNIDKTLYQLSLFIGTIPNFDLPEVQAQVSNPAGYAAGATKLSVASFVKGDFAALYPMNTITENGGRKITIGANSLRVIGLDPLNQQLITTPLATPVAMGDVLHADPISSVLPGKHYLLPTELFDPGTIFLGENRPPIFRNAATRESFELVLTI